jgi:hypothetical protein
MLSRELAVALRDAGLTWTPQNGDRFVVPDRDLDEMVFVLSDMVVEEVRLPDGTHVLAFNGTTEWALDALEASEAIWVPSEAQLRERLDDAFETLERLDAPPGGYAVTAAGARHVDVSAANAYARALLHQLQKA